MSPGRRPGTHPAAPEQPSARLGAAEAPSSRVSAVRARRGRTGARRRLPARWVLAFVVFTLLSWSWSLATPLFGSPDEPAHVIKAAAVARGQLLPPRGSGPVPVVRVPVVFEKSPAYPACFAFRPDTTADCSIEFTGPASEAGVGTPAGRYPPLYYALVGLPSRAFPSAVGVYLMRFVSGLVCAGFLAGAVTAAAAANRLRPLVIGVAVATTPMVLFLSGMVNPNSLEIAAALCLWVCGLALASETPDRAVPGLLAGAGASASTLVLTRGLSRDWRRSERQSVAPTGTFIKWLAS